MFEPRLDAVHLPLVFGLARTGRAAPDIFSVRRPRTNRHVNVQMRRVVMNAVGVADGIAAVIGLVELQHYAFHRGMQNLIGIDANAGQRVVLLLRHGKNEPVRDDRTFCRRGKSCEMLTPAFGDPQFPLRIGKLGRRRVRSIGIDADVIVE